jgi:hypothetical protein
MTEYLPLGELMRNMIMNKTTNLCSASSKLFQGVDSSLKIEIYKVDICVLTLPSILIYALERSYYDFPAELANHPANILEVKLGELNSFTSYSHGRLDFNPLNKNIGRYQVQARLIDKRTLIVVSASAFQVTVEGSEKDPKKARCPDKGKDS